MARCGETERQGAVLRVWRAALTLLGAAAMLVSVSAGQLAAQEAASTSAPAPASAPAAAPAPLQPTDSEKLFLDRLMIAESGGREDAKNPRSSALGPYQFLGSTFLDVMGRYFQALIDGKTEAEILQLRTDHAVSRNAALVYTRENAAFLLERGLEASAAHLRLAFLVGPTGAQRVIAAEAKTPVTELLSAGALEANPFLRGMTAEELIARSAREAAGVRLVTLPAGTPGARPRPPGIRVRCNLARPSCRKWLALAQKRQSRKASAQMQSGPNGAQPEKVKD